jgi:GT2 family glycosyltransferase
VSAERVLAVVVLYGPAREESATLQSVRDALAADPGLAALYEFLLWDNSPQPLASPPAFAHYVHEAANNGTAGACNGAAKRASKQGYSWMLALDQDTVLPAGFLRDMYNTSLSVSGQPDIAAIAPTVLVGDFVVSPRMMLRNRHRPYPRGESGPASGEAAAINSGTMFRVSDLLAIGGYHPGFWLDYSDWYVFHQFFRAGRKTWRAADIVLHHSMTVMDYDNLMSISRYRNLLTAEEAYTDLYRGPLEGAMQTGRLVLRAAKQRIRFKNPEFSRITVRHLIRRLLTTRAQRITRWEADIASRAAGSSSTSSPLTAQVE